MRRVSLLASGCIVLSLLAAAALMRLRFFQMDEFVFVRAAWLCRTKAVPYRDFFEHHTPLLYTLLQHVFRIAPETPEALFWCRGANALVLLLVLSMSWKISKNMYGSLPALFSVTLLVACPAWIHRAIEVRPDLLATFFFLLGSSLLLKDNPSRNAVFCAGVSLALAVLSTQKSLLYVSSWLVLWFCDRLSSLDKKARGELIPHPSCLISGFLGVAAVLACCMATSGALGAFIEQNVGLAWRWQTNGEGFLPLSYLRAAIVGAPLWSAVTAMGVFLALSQKELIELAGWRRNWILLTVTVFLWASLFLNPIPWPYNMLPVFSWMSLFGAAFFRYALDRYSRRRFLPFGISLLLVLNLAVFVVNWQRELGRSNAWQFTVLEKLYEVTPAGTAVFDTNGTYLFRPSASWYWYHSRAMRILLKERFSREMVSSLERKGVWVWLCDSRRFPELPKQVRRYLLSNFKRFFGPIYIWGKDFSGAGEKELIIPADGFYFWISLGENSPQLLSIDGSQVPERQAVYLERGGHRLLLGCRNHSDCAVSLLRSAPGSDYWVPRRGLGRKFFEYFF